MEAKPTPGGSVPPALVCPAMENCPAWEQSPFLPDALIFIFFVFFVIVFFIFTVCGFVLFLFQFL